MKMQRKNILLAALLALAALSAIVGVNGCSLENYDVELTALEVTPADQSIATSSTQQFTATGSYSDGSTKDLTNEVTWTSSDTSVATISAAGTATAEAILSTQSTVITATEPGGMSVSTTLTVVNAPLVSIAVTPAAPSIANGTTQQFTATGTYSDVATGGSTTITQDLTAQVTWASSVPGVATISSSGLATSTGAGTTDITAEKDGITSPVEILTVNNSTLVSITVTPANTEIGKGGAQQFTATGNFDIGSPQDISAFVTWSSSNTAAATINSSGRASVPASATDNDTTTITAATSGGALGTASGTAVLTVKPGSGSS